MLSSGIMQRAFAEAIVLGLACGPLGVWILLLRRAYAAESLSHAMLPGLVIAALAGVPLILGAAGGVLVAAGGIALVARDARAGGDVGVAVVVSGLFGLGGILALSPETPPRLGELLFGDLLGITNGDLVAAAALSAGVLIALAAGYRALAATAFARGSAQALGIRPGARRPRAARAAGRHDGRRRPGAREPAAGRADPRARRRRAQPRPAAARDRSRWPPGLAVLAGIAGLVISYEFEIAAGASVALCAVALSSLGLLKPKLGVP